jgi:hypothetical protein
MILVLFVILFFWITLVIARGVAATPFGFLLICAVLAYAFGIWIIVGIAIAVAALLWMAQHPGAA